MKVALELQDVVVERRGRVVLDIADLKVQQGEVLTVIGPNGAGKSTLLLALAQLIRPDRGQIYFQGRPLAARKGLAYRRRIGLVLQVPLLLKASVIDNVMIGLRFRRIPKRERRAQAEKWLSRFGIADLADRPAGELSGGESQRVSLARAFVLNPDILMLDEPFSSLDAPTRAQLLSDFQALLANTAMTTIFVTHDMNEALLLGDRVAVLLEGRLRQVGSPDQVFSAPADPDVAAFIGVDTTVLGQVVATENGQVIVSVGERQVEAVADVSVGRSVMVCLRPEDVTLWVGDDLPPSSARNKMSGPIVRMTPQGPLVNVVVDCGFPVSALITRTSAREMGLAPGSQVTATFKASVVHLIAR
jgi:tungstate transport system ATP-binding protein